MNIFSFIAIILSILVLIIGLFLSTKDISIFFDPISLFIVFGGTIAATSISFRLDRIVLLLRVFVARILKDKGHEINETISDMMILADLNRKNPDLLKIHLDKVRDPFLKEAMLMISEDVFSKDEVFTVLNNRVANIFQHYMADAGKFKTIGKFPPAFGLMGTTIGMIVLLANLSGADAAKTIGPAMSICLITTLYGVALANLFMIPVAENLISSAKEQLFKNTLILEGVQLIYEKKSPVYLAEVLNSHLLPGDRIDWKKVVKK